MELRHLRYFVAVAEELNFSRAAERLHMAQPPLSQQIRSLEQELGVQLFERTKHQVRLTTAGIVFLQEARLTLQAAEQAIRTAQRASRGEIGRLVVGFASVAAYSVLPEILRVFRERFPEIEFLLYELNTGLQVQGLLNSAIDVGFLFTPIHESGLELMSVREEPLVVALPETHPLATLPQVSVSALADESFILFPRHLAPSFYDLILSASQQAGFSPKVAQEANQLQTMINLVAGGMGIALVPACLQNLQRTGVVYKDLQGKVSHLQTAMIWRRNDSSSVLYNFIQVVKETIQMSQGFGL
ncbi:MAG TPA: LysR substrate-binding domain-containing protein [Waterburya sp.]